MPYKFEEIQLDHVRHTINVLKDNLADRAMSSRIPEHTEALIRMVEILVRNEDRGMEDITLHEKQVREMDMIIAEAEDPEGLDDAVEAYEAAVKGDTFLEDVRRDILGEK